MSNAVSVSSRKCTMHRTVLTDLSRAISVARTLYVPLVARYFIDMLHESVQKIDKNKKLSKLVSAGMILGGWVGGGVCYYSSCHKNPISTLGLLKPRFVLYLFQSSLAHWDRKKTTPVTPTVHISPSIRKFDSHTPPNCTAFITIKLLLGGHPAVHDQVTGIDRVAPKRGSYWYMCCTCFIPLCFNTLR